MIVSSSRVFTVHHMVLSRARVRGAIAGTTAGCMRAWGAGRREWDDGDRRAATIAADNVMRWEGYGDDLGDWEWP